MQNVTNTAPETARQKKELDGTRDQRTREIRDHHRLSLLFALFSLHTRQVLQQHGMTSAWQTGFALVNALIFGEVILIAQVLEVGKSLERRALMWIVLGKSLIFAVLLIAFHIAEDAIRAWFESQPLSKGLADFAPRPPNSRCHFLCCSYPVLRIPGGRSHPRGQCTSGFIRPQRRERVSADRSRLVKACKR